MPTLGIELNIIGQLGNDNDALQQIDVPMSRNSWIKIHPSEVRKNSH